MGRQPAAGQGLLRGVAHRMIQPNIIDIRLDHVTEDYGLIDDAQEGFRQGRSTKRQLAKLHTAC